MSRPRHFAAYPRQIVALALEFEQGGGRLLRRQLSPSLALQPGGIARQIANELRGLRNAIEREGLAGDWPAFLSSRIYLSSPVASPRWIDPPLAPGEIAIVGADYLPWAQALDGSKELSSPPTD